MDRKAAENPRPNTARASLRIGRARMTAKVQMTTGGIAAVGGLVSSILLSTAVLVWVSTSVARRHPIASAALRRR